MSRIGKSFGNLTRSALEAVASDEEDEKSDSGSQNSLFKAMCKWLKKRAKTEEEKDPGWQASSP